MHAFIIFKENKALGFPLFASLQANNQNRKSMRNQTQLSELTKSLTDL